MGRPKKVLSAEDMEAREAAKPVKDPRKAPKHTSVAKLVNQLAINPNLSQRQLAKINNVSQQSISEMFKRYGINQNYLERFKENRADIFAGVQEAVLSSLSEEDIKKASVRDRTILAGTLYDKERLERGQSTSNSSVFFQIVAESDQAD